MTHYATESSLSPDSRDDLRKSALRAALGITSIRQTSEHSEYLPDIEQGVRFCKALQTYVSSPSRPPVREPDLYIWDVLHQAVSDESRSDEIDIDKLRRGVESCQPLLEDILRGEAIDGKRLLEAERFLRRASSFLE